MAYSSAALSSDELAWMTADKPLWLGEQVHRDLTSSTRQWRTSGSWATGSDGTLSTAPTSCLSDGFVHRNSEPSSAAATWYLQFDWSAAPVTIDALLIVGHNFGSIGGLTVSFEIANNNAYSSGLIELASWSPGTSTKRLAGYSLKHTGVDPLRYSNVPYGRFKITKGSTFTPIITELFLGQRTQLKELPDDTWDPNQQRTSGQESRGSTGVRTFYVNAEGQRIINATLSPYETARIGDVEDFWEATIDHGTRPFVWCDAPTSNPQASYLMIPPRELRGAYIGPMQRSFPITLEEQGDLFVSMEA